MQNSLKKLYKQKAAYASNETYISYLFFIKVLIGFLSREKNVIL